MNSKTNNLLPYCPKCTANTKVHRAGHRKTASGIIKQRYFCRDCDYKFIVSPETPPISYPDEFILYAFSLSKQITYTYKKEIKLSLREIAHMVNKKFNTKIDHNIISYWLKNYIPNKFTTSVTPNGNTPENQTKLLKPNPDRIFKPFKIVSTSIIKEDLD